jgi:hypothetical protein
MHFWFVHNKMLQNCIYCFSHAHPTSCPMGTGALSPAVKRLGRVADHSPPISAEVKKTWISTSTPRYIFMA